MKTLNVIVLILFLFSAQLFAKVTFSPPAKTKEFLLEVSKGNVPGHSKMWGMGERESLAVVVTGEDIWRGTTSALPIPNQTTGEQMSLVSTSTSDDVGGTGIISVTIHYLDVDWTEQTEIRTMDGTTEVDTVATDMKFIQDIHAATVGSVGVAVGNITIYKKGASATVYDELEAGGNMSLTVNKMVPAGKTLYLTSWTASAIEDKPIFMRIRSTDHNGILHDGGTPVFLFKDTVSLVGGGTYVRRFDVPVKIPSKSIIKISGWATSGGTQGSVSASWEGVLINN